jgi:putative membrane protein
LEAPLRDKLAIDRTRLANKRTFLAMLRTGLYFSVMGLSVLNIKQLENLQNYSWIFFGISVVFIVLGVISYYKMDAKIKKDLADSLKESAE